MSNKHIINGSLIVPFDTNIDTGSVYFMNISHLFQISFGRSSSEFKLVLIFKQKPELICCYSSNSKTKPLIYKPLYTLDKNIHSNT